MTEKTKTIQPGMTQHAPKTITRTEGDKLIKYLHSQHNYTIEEPNRIRNAAMAVLMLDAGLRVGELVQLRQSSLILDAQPTDDLYLEASITKTHSERTIPMTERCKIAIGEMQERVWSTMPIVEDMFAFYATITVKHITVRQVQRIVGAASKAAIGRSINPHVLRQTFATRMMRVAPSRVVQQLLGHKSLSSTQVYTHPNGDDLKKAIAALND